MPQEPLNPIQGAVFFAGGEDGLRAFSRDGETWTNVQTDREGTLASLVAFRAGHCVLVARFGGESLGYSTTDGVKWERQTLEVQPYTRVQLLYADSDAFHFVSGGNDKSDTARSMDGVHWEPRQPMFPPGQKSFEREGTMRRMARGADGRLVIVGDYGIRLTRAPSDSQWSFVPKPQAKDSLIDITYGNGVFVGGGMHGLCMRSTDGLTWTDRTVGEEGEHINAMIWDGRQFAGIGQGATYFSPDGRTWRRETNENAPTSATFGAGIYVGALWPGKVMRSTDAVHWKEVHQFDHHILSLAYGELSAGQADKT